MPQPIHYVIAYFLLSLLFWVFLKLLLGTITKPKIDPSIFKVGDIWESRDDDFGEKYFVQIESVGGKGVSYCSYYPPGKNSPPCGPCSYTYFDIFLERYRFSGSAAKFGNWPRSVEGFTATFDSVLMQSNPQEIVCQCEECRNATDECRNGRGENPPA